MAKPTPEQAAAFRWLLMNNPDVFLIGVRLMDHIAKTCAEWDRAQAELKRMLSGEHLPVVATRQGLDGQGFTRYTLTLEDGTPLGINPGDVTGYYLAMLPARSTVEIDL